MTNPTPDKLREEIDGLRAKIQKGLDDMFDLGMKADSLPEDFMNGTTNSRTNHIMKDIKSHTNSVLEGLLEEMPEKRIVISDEDNEDLYSSQRLRHEIQENNINFGFNNALDQCKSIIRNVIDNE